MLAVDTVDLPVVQLLALLENSADCIVVFSPELHALYANEAALAHVGLTRERGIGRHISECLSHLPELVALWEPRIRELLATGELRRFEDCLSIGGRSVWSESVLSPIRGDDGAITAIGLVYRDVTERKTALQHLRDSEARYREGEQQFAALVASFNDVLWSASLDARKLLYLSPGTERVYGRPLEEFFADQSLWTKVVHPEDAGKAEQAVADTFAKGSAETEYRIIRPDGEVRWLSDRKYIVRDPSGRPVAIGGIATDVTEQKKTEQALEESEERFRSLVEQAMDGVLMVDPADLRICFANPSMCQMLGYTHEELTSKTLADVHPAAFIAEMREAFQRPLARTYSVEVAMYRKDGGTVYVHLNAFVVKLDDRIYVAGHFRDLTESLRARDTERWYQQRLRALAMEVSLAEERERRRLAGELHDEVWQILSLLQIKLSDHLQHEHREECRRHASEMRSLIDRAARATRSLTLQMSHPALYDLGLVAAAEWLAEDVGQLYGLRVMLEVDGASEVEDVRLRVVIFQCLRELLVNAAKHAGVKQVQTRIARQAESLLIEVRDEGKGFVLPSQTEPQAAGFGLFGIRERLKNLGGKLEICSRPGAGTAVRLIVPLTPAEGEYSLPATTGWNDYANRSPTPDLPSAESSDPTSSADAASWDI